jgi:hypothetical protein
MDQSFQLALIPVVAAAGGWAVKQAVDAWRCRSSRHAAEVATERAKRCALIDPLLAAGAESLAALEAPAGMHGAARSVARDRLRSAHADAATASDPQVVALSARIWQAAERRDGAQLAETLGELRTLRDG